MNFHEYLTHNKEVIDKHVPGWFYTIDIILLYGILNEIQDNIRGDICEIGVAYGKSAITLSHFKRHEDILYLYDIFDEDMRKQAETNILTFCGPQNLVWRIEDTLDIDQEDLQFDSTLRMLHIDGCHEYSAVLNDLSLFSNKVGEFGVIVVDDFNDYEYPGVNAAVYDFINSRSNIKNWRIFAVGNNKVYLCQKSKMMFFQSKTVDFIEKAKKEMGISFPIPMCLREMKDTNVLLVESREDWTPDEIKTKLFDKPRIG